MILKTENQGSSEIELLIRVYYNKKSMDPKRVNFIALSSIGDRIEIYMNIDKTIKIFRSECHSNTRITYGRFKH